MTWAVPNWYALALLAAAAFRTWWLLAQDSILDGPRTRVVHALPKGEEWLLCPWCAGAWLSVAWWLAWVAWPHWALVVAAPFAISAIVGIVGSLTAD